MMMYLLAFCRVTVGLVFAVSSYSKARDIARFQEAVFGFHLLSRRLSHLAALLFLGAEFAVVMLIIIGGPLLLAGFVLAIFLLLIFCVALASALHRGVKVACSCFGPSNKPVAPLDIWRNAGFLLCAGVGTEILLSTRGEQGNLGTIEWLLIALGAVAFVTIWLQLSEIVQLFH